MLSQFPFCSPNTPGLRNLQGKQELADLIKQVLNARETFLQKKIPILLKIAPDLEEIDKVDIASVIMDDPQVRFKSISSI